MNNAEAISCLILRIFIHCLYFNRYNLDKVSHSKANEFPLSISFIRFLLKNLIRFIIMEKEIL